MSENDSNNNNFNDNYNIIEEFVSEQTTGESPVVNSVPEQDERTPSSENVDVRTRRITVEELPSEESKPYVRKEPNFSEPVKPKKNSGKLGAGLLGALIGLLLGGVGVYAGIVLSKTPLNCPATNCGGEEEKPVYPPTTSENNHDFDFLKLETASKNLIYSPLSINSALGLLDAGADGETKTEIDNFLGGAEVAKYENIPDKLSLANAVFIRNDFKDEVLESYISEVTTNNNADIIFDSFESEKVFDDWAGNKTFGLINNLGIDPKGTTEMVLANALAIQMDWQYKFDEGGVYDDKFYNVNEEETTVSTLHEDFKNANVYYAKTDDLTAVTLPLDSGSESVNLEFVALMPKNNLGEYVENFDLDKWSKTLSELTPANEPEGGIAVSIPKFKFDYQLNLMDDLKTLGVTSAFTNSANFSRLAKTSIYVGDAIHKANIEFTETGIKAAAVTAFGMEAMALPQEETPDPIAITIDHPFLFLIRDRGNGTIWFIGTVYNPGI